MKQTIEIEVPEGKKAIWKDGKVVFEDLKPKLPKTWTEFCNNYKIQKEECYINTDADIEKVVLSRNRLICGDSNILPNKQAAEAHLALIKLHQLRDCYRQGWTPTLNKTSFGIIRREEGDLEVEKFIFSSKFLSFQYAKMAQDFLNNFRDLIEQAGDLI